MAKLTVRNDSGGVLYLEEFGHQMLDNGAQLTLTGPRNQFLDADQLSTLIDSGDIVVIDVRGDVLVSYQGQNMRMGPHDDEIEEHAALRTVLYAKKASVGSITKGDPVYITGYNPGNTNFLIEIAESDTANWPAVAIANGDAITDTQGGHIVVSGRIDNMDTSSWTTGDTLYVSATGTLTSTAPTGIVNKIQCIATVLYAHATDGCIMVHGTGQGNNLPNVTNGSFWMGGGGDVATETVAQSGFNLALGTGAGQVAEGNHAHDWDAATGTADDVPFNSAVTKPGHSEGVVFYDKDEHTLAVFNDEADVTHQLGQEGFIRVYNDSGATIVNGKVVHISGSEVVEDRPTIALAQANTKTTSEVIGFATHDIENNSFGYVTYWGLINDLDTSAFSDGDTLFLDETTAGAIRNSAPPQGNYEVQMGFVVKSHLTTGRVLVALNQDLASLAGDADGLVSDAQKQSAGTLNPGDVVRVTAWDNAEGVVEVELADASSPSQMPAFGIVRETITNNTVGKVAVSGVLTGMDTSSWAVGTDLYVSEAIGELTNTKPTGTALIQKIAVVLRSHASFGVIQIFGAGRANDLPNIPNGKIWVGNGSGVPQETSTNTGFNLDLGTGAGQVAEGNHTHGIDDLTDVDTTTSPPGTNEYLQWNGSNWIPTVGGIGTAEVDNQQKNVTSDEVVSSSTSSSSFIIGGAMSLTTSNTSALDYLIHFSTTASNASGSNTLTLELWIDGTMVTERTINPAKRQDANLVWLVTGLATAKVVEVKYTTTNSLTIHRRTLVIRGIG